MSPFLKNLAYAATSRYLGVAIGLGIIALLARLVDPTEFGIIAAGGIFIGFFGMIAEAGLGPAIVGARNISASDFRSLFGFTVWIAAGAGIAFFFFSDLIGDWYGNVRIADVCRCLTVMLVFSILNIVPQNILVRRKRFDILSRRVIAVQILTGGASIWAAFAGWGVYALVLQQIGSMILTFFANYLYARISPRLFFDRRPLKAIASFSAFQFFFNLVNYFSRNLDRLIIGKSLSLVDLGFYDKATSLSAQPVHNIAGVASSVAYPYLAEYSDRRDGLSRAYRLILKSLLAVSFPVAAFCTATAEDLILLVFGDGWSGAVVPFAILSLAITVRIPQIMEGTILQACGSTRLLFFLGLSGNAIALCSLGAAVAAGGSLEDFAIAYAVASTATFLVSVTTILKVCFGLSPQWHFVRLPLLLSMLFVADVVVVKSVGYAASSAEFPLLASLGVRFLVWSILSVVCLRLFTGTLWRETVAICRAT